MRINRRHRPAPYLPFITLADIAWQIIIFFMTAASFLMSFSLTVPLPQAAMSISSTVPRTIRVNVTESAMTVNDRQVPAGDLELILTGLLTGITTEEERTVVVSFSDDVPFQRNADILYAIQQARGVVLISTTGGPK